MPNQPSIEPIPVVQLVDAYVDKALGDCLQFDNSEPLDDSGVWSLHRLAAQVYAMGWDDAERAVSDRERTRERRAEKQAAVAARLAARRGT